MKRARAVGCDGVLVKPFEPQMVINRVKDLLAGRRPAGLWTASPTAQGPTRHSPAPEREPGRAVAVPPAPPASGGSLEDYFDRLDAAFANLEAAPHHPDSAPHASPQPLAVEAAIPPERAHAAGPEPAELWRDAAASSTPPPWRAASGVPADVLDGWDPDLAGDPKRVEPVSTAPPPAPVEPPEVAVEEPPSPVPFVPFHVSSPVQTPMPPSSPPPAPAPVPAQAATSSLLPVSTTMPPASAPPSAPIAPTVPSAVSPPPPSVPSMPSLAEAFSALLSAEQSRVISPSASGATRLSDAALDEIVRRVIARMSDRAVRETVVDVAERLVREEIERIKGAAHNL